MGYGHRTNTAFYEKWGERPCDIAERDKVSIHAIGMRIHNFGNPYQRVKSPSRMEIIYGVTNYQMLLWTRVPQSILTARLAKMEAEGNTADIPWLFRRSRAKYDTCDLKSVHRPQVWGWLMPEHENYSDWWQRPEYVKQRVKDLLPEYKLAEAQSNVKSWKEVKNI
jgi:hypothetical protein